MAEIPNLRLTLSNRPENVVLVRQALTGLAEAVGLDPLELSDINTAVSEACNNVVLHAYGGGEGPLEIDVRIAQPVLEILVRDRGGGIRPRGEPSESADGGIGLPVIQALAQHVELRDLAGEGTEVRMEFASPGAATLEPVSAGEDGFEFGQIGDSMFTDKTAMTIQPGVLAGAVLPRVLCSLAARAHFSTDRISDTQMLADALLAQLDGSISGSRLGFGIGVAPYELELRVGPLRNGRSAAVIEACALDGVGALLERLTDGHEVAPEGSAELLKLRLIEQQHGAPAGPPH
jgi:serine/threonine-protein kinase RsbW